MKTLVKELDFCSLEVLKSQRESLRRLYQVLKAMTGIKKGTEMRRKQEEHYDF